MIGTGAQLVNGKQRVPVLGHKLRIRVAVAVYSGRVPVFVIVRGAMNEHLKRLVTQASLIVEKSRDGVGVTIRESHREIQAIYFDAVGVLRLDADSA